MLFVSPLFLSLFLPITLLLYAATSVSYRNLILLVASLFFYSWGEPSACLVMIVLILLNYCAALLIHHLDYKKLLFTRRAVLLFAIIANLAVLFVYKYLDFTIGNINVVLRWLSLPEFSFIHISLPVGISFYCFQALSYVIDVYRKEVDVQTSLPKLALYISLFPQLIAGPIVRYSTICGELTQRYLKLDNIFEGAVRFTIGLAKKVFIADNMGFIADSIFINNVSTIPQLWAWVGCIAYTLQIYYDFSAYSDMAIGLGRIFNFHFLENFNFPYSATSIKDFWRRWHISLSSWLRDYLYIPLGGNRISTGRTIFNQFIVFLVCGLWHGAAWNFIVWGVWHGFGLISERFTGKFIKKMPKIVCNLYTLLFVMIGWVIFRSPDLSYATHYLKIMFLGNSQYDIYSFIHVWANCITISNGLIFFLGLLFSYPISGQFSQFFTHKPIGILIITILFVVSYMFAMTSTFSPFIYFRF